MVSPLLRLHEPLLLLVRRELRGCARPRHLVVLLRWRRVLLLIRLLGRRELWELLLLKVLRLKLLLLKLLRLKLLLILKRETYLLPLNRRV